MYTCILSLFLVKGQLMVDLKELKEISSSLNILYVEDDRDIAKTIINYLSKLFNEIVYAENGNDALEFYKQKEFDIVISDINMPQMSGLDLIKQIKEINGDQNVIIISAYSDSNNFITSIKLGVDGYIVKPVNYNDMNALLYKLSSKIKKFNEHDINLEQQKFLMDHISQKNQLLRQYTDVIDKVAIVSKTDLKGTITYANDFFCEISGYTKDEVIGQSHNIVRHEDMAKSVYSELWSTIKDGKVWEGTIKNKAKDGTAYFVHATIFPMFGKDNEISEYMGIRFLTTKEEVEKREFKKKVRSTYQEYKKSAIEANKKIAELNHQLSSKTQNDNFKDETIKDLKEKLGKFKSQVKYYEDEIKNIKMNNENRLNHLADKTTEVNSKISDKKRELDVKKNEIKKLKEDNELKQKEIVKLNNELIDQRKIIYDLRDTIKNIEEDDE